MFCVVGPANGRLENVACGNVYGSVCRLVCYKGYELRGSVERKCDKIAGTNVVQWTGNTTSCLSKLPRLCLVAGNAKPCSTIKKVCMEHTLWCYSFDATVGFWTISALFTSCFAKLRKKAQKIVCLLLTHFSPTFPQFSSNEEWYLYTHFPFRYYENDGRPRNL